jgi:hypothetical protein
VYLFDSSRPEHWACATCGNIVRTRPELCDVHRPNMERLIGGRISAARMNVTNTPIMSFMPLRLLALNILNGLADTEINRELKLVAEEQMIGPVGDRTPSYRQLLAVLTEASAAAPPSSPSPTPAVAAPKDGEFKNDPAPDSKG